MQPSSLPKKIEVLDVHIIRHGGKLHSSITLYLNNNNEKFVFFFSVAEKIGPNNGSKPLNTSSTYSRQTNYPGKEYMKNMFKFSVILKSKSSLFQNSDQEPAKC